jgi:hypothetical protein
MWFFRHVAPQLIAYTNEHSTAALYIVGHSLGAATAAILTIMLTDYMDEFQKGKDEEFTLKCYCYAPACCLNLELAEKYIVKERNSAIYIFILIIDIYRILFSHLCLLMI